MYRTIHKLTSRVKFKSRLLLSDFLRASEGPPLVALTLIAPPLLLAIVTLKFIFIDRSNAGPPVAYYYIVVLTPRPR